MYNVKKTLRVVIEKIKICRISPTLPSPSEAVPRALCAAKNILMLQIRVNMMENRTKSLFVSIDCLEF